ncbi:MAG: lamin tail domain-containing protein [Imperialibacter sp.]|uniref:lamin tail domain-containing protein n=1 Tax=Imperialibacter sp. TaxID=2038411 RepID=UPI0032EF9025
MKKHLLTALFFLAALSLAAAQDLRIYHIDVNQADATLFVTATGHSLLVDSGNNGSGKVLFATMQQAGISRIDCFIDTHYHSDHYGGIDELVNNHNVQIVQAYDRGDKDILPAAKKREATYIDYHNAVGKNAGTLRAGHEFELGGMRVQCLASGGQVIGNGPSIGTDENDLSVAILVTYNGFRYFVGGDIHDTIEVEIAASSTAKDVDMYQANHHGSETSSAESFLASMKPSVIVISNGSDNGYGHPRQSTLDHMAALDPRPDIFQTNKFTKTKAGAGNVADQFIADLDPAGNEGTIVTELTGSSYNVSFGSFSKTYQVKAPATSSSNVAVVIESLVPDPAGADADNEEVVIKNKGTASVSLTGWVLRDASSRIWVLTSTLAAGESLAIVRNRQAMSLNNDGDLVELLNANGDVIDSFRYLDAKEGQRVLTGH